MGINKQEEEENGNPKSCSVPFQRTTEGGLMGYEEMPKD